MEDKVITAFLLLSVILLVYHQTYYGMEGFVLNPSVSSTEAMQEGASEYYNWGYKSPEDPSIPHTVHTCGRCQNKCYIPTPYQRQKYPCPYCRKTIRVKNEFNFIKQNSCQTCDITQNKDIDKYVLKSSVPPCPDMSQYMKKSSMLAQDPTQGGKYVRKEDCPKCPVCPICPKCPGDNNGYGNGYNNGGGDYGFSYSEDSWGGDEPGIKNVMIPKDGNEMSRRTRHISKKIGRPVLSESSSGSGWVKPYEPPFAYNNRSSGKVYAYNKFNPDWGNSPGWSFNVRG